MTEIFGRPVDLVSRRAIERSRNPYRRQAILSPPLPFMSRDRTSWRSCRRINPTAVLDFNYHCDRWPPAFFQPANAMWPGSPCPRAGRPTWAFPGSRSLQEPRVVDDVAEARQTDFALADVLVTIHPRAEARLGIVEVKGQNRLPSDQLLHPPNRRVPALPRPQIKARRKKWGGVQAKAQPLRLPDRVENCRQMLDLVAEAIPCPGGVFQARRTPDSLVAASASSSPATIRSSPRSSPAPKCAPGCRTKNAAPARPRRKSPGPTTARIWRGWRRRPPRLMR